MRETVRLIGIAIRRGSVYLPLRNHAAALATTAPPKDFLGQAKAIYDHAVDRWRYVKDPVSKELLTFDPHALWQLVLAGDGIGVGLGKGGGDCDCIAAAVGAELEAIGMPVRLGVTAPPSARPGNLFAHVFVQTKVPGYGWVTVDPVLHPHKSFGAFPKASRAAFFDLSGRLIGHRGNVAGRLSGNLKGDPQMLGTIAPLEQWPDMGLGGVGAEPEDWRQYGPDDFGAYAETMGIEPLDGVGLAAEVDLELLEGPDGIVRVGARTPILEVTPRDITYVRKHGRPYDGMGAVSDTGAIYAYDGSLGFFSKIFSAAKSVVSKVASAAKKVISKIPGGKYLIKLGEKIHKIAMKFVAPLSKFVGKYASKLAPVAALIPGYGPAIAAGLYTAGKVANLMNKYGVILKGKKGSVRKLKFKSGSKAKKFRKALKKQARKEKRKMKRLGKGAYKANIRHSANKKGARVKKLNLAGYDGIEDDNGASEFLGAVAPAQRMRRMFRRGRRIAKGLPVKAGPVAFGPRARRVMRGGRPVMRGGARKGIGPWGRSGPYAHLFRFVPPGPRRKQLIEDYLRRHPAQRRR